MADTILGLPTSQKFKEAGDRFYNHRRQILHLYPQGGATLTGLLSLAREEETNDTQVIWYEKRFIQPRTSARGTNPLTTTAPSSGDANDGTGVGTATLAVNTSYYLKVASTKEARVGYIIELANEKRMQFYVTGVTRGVTDAATNGYLTVSPVRAVAHVATDSAADTVIRYVGTAMGEGAPGAGLKPLGFVRPYAISNQTYIHRTPFEFSGTVLQEGLKYDKSGPYKERAKDAVIEHMTGLERALLMQKRSTTMRPSATSGAPDEPVRTMSGLIEFLEMWDAGSNGIQIDGQTYAPYAFKSPSTTDDDDDKRIIENADGVISVDKFNMWAERVSRVHTAKTSDKLVLCGTGAILALAKMFRENSTFQVKYDDEAYGLNFTTLSTPFCKFHFMTHPLFTEDPVQRNWALIVDVWNIIYRPLRNRDTRLLKNRQNPGDDLRRDEFLTESTIEVHNPESCMLIKNIRNYSEV